MPRLIIRDPNNPSINVSKSTYNITNIRVKKNKIKQKYNFLSSLKLF